MSDAGSSGPVAVAPTEDRTLAYVAYGLLIAGLFTFGVTSLIAVVISATQTGGKDPLLVSHYKNQVRIFLIAAIAFGLFFVLCILSAIELYAPFALAGLFVLMAAGVGAALLSILGIIKLSEGKMAGKLAAAPMAAPASAPVAAAPEQPAVTTGAPPSEG